MTGNYLPHPTRILTPRRARSRPRFWHAFRVRWATTPRPEGIPTPVTEHGRLPGWLEFAVRYRL